MKHAILIALFGAGPLWAASAMAALGGDAAGIAADGVALHGVLSATVGTQYDVREITSNTGTRVRQYLNRDGVVFAVGWDGPVVPNLQRLLGTYYPQYAAAIAAQEHPGLHRGIRVASAELIVEAGGHLRAYAGRAYLPALTPPGVPAAQLR